MLPNDSTGHEAAIVQVPGEQPLDHSGARGDDELVGLWIARQRSAETKRAYLHDSTSFLDFLGQTGRTLQTATVRELQGWIEQLTGAPSTRARRVAAIKSLLSFGQNVGYLRFNVGKAVSTPTVPDDLAERIMSESEVRALLAAAAMGKGNAQRNSALLRFLYVSGARISEACGLRFRHVHHAPTGVAMVTLHGKRGKTRHVTVSKRVAEALEALRDGADDDDFVFRSKTGRALHPVNVSKMIRSTAKRAGIERKVSAHWFRHAHASHALDRGASIALVKESLGHASLGTTSRYTHARAGDSAGLYLDDI